MNRRSYPPAVMVVLVLLGAACASGDSADQTEIASATAGTAGNESADTPKSGGPADGDTANGQSSGGGAAAIDSADAGQAGGEATGTDPGRPTTGDAEAPADADGDGHSDEAEGAGRIDTDGDGITDDQDPDSDGDGIQDREESAAERPYNEAEGCPASGCQPSPQPTPRDCETVSERPESCDDDRCDADQDQKVGSAQPALRVTTEPDGDDDGCDCDPARPGLVDPDCDSTVGDGVVALGRCGLSVGPIGPGNHPGYAFTRLAINGDEIAVGCGGFAPDTVEWDQFLTRVEAWASPLDITVIASDFQLVLTGPTAILQQPAFGMPESVLGGQPQQEPPEEVTVEAQTLAEFVGGDLVAAAPALAVGLALDGQVFDQEQSYRILRTVPRQTLIDRARLGDFDSAADRVTLAVAIDPGLVGELRSVDGIELSNPVTELDGLDSVAGTLIEDMTIGEARELAEVVTP